MKKTFSALFLILTSITSYSQVELNIDAISEKGSIAAGSISKGPIHISKVSYVPNTNQKHKSPFTSESSYYIYGEQNGKKVELDCKMLPNDIKLLPTTNSLEEYWQIQNIMSLPRLSRFYNIYEARSDMEYDAYNYNSKLEDYGLLLDDPYLESYVYGLVSKISPKQRPDGFPYGIKVVFIKDETTNISITNNGILSINVGMLAAMHTEDELIAAISHEMAHFVSNHSLINIQKSELRKSRAEFWAGFATIMAAATETYAASQGVNTYGSLTLNTAIISTAITSDIIERIGINYDKEQEKEADLSARYALKLLNYDTNALATLLSNIEKQKTEEFNWSESAYISKSHTTLSERIEYCGTPYKRTDKNFEIKVSSAITSTATLKYLNGRFSQALKYVSLNISNGVGSADDYNLKAQCLIKLYDDEKNNKEAYDAILKANELNPNIDNRKTEIILLLRMNKVQNTIETLNGYINDLNSAIKSEFCDSNRYTYLINEYEWAQKTLMIASQIK